jgi:hypothetical protein
MIGTVRKATLAALLAATSACGDDPAPDASDGPRVGYARDVSPILERHCVSCHGSSAFAPFPLLSYDDAVEHGDDAVDAIAARKMPLCAEFEERCRPSAEELGTLMRWLAQGSPR